MEAHIQGFVGRHFCPRMATMNKPAFASITTYAPEKPALVFVASRRQTRLTALEFIALCAADESPKRFLHMPEGDMGALCDVRVKDEALKHTLAFGIGIHHAGLCEEDRALVEELFLSLRIQASAHAWTWSQCALHGTAFSLQVLVCTATLAWGINLPARLVVVKGTEYFDASSGRYVDMVSGV
jgi:activating signal cointegrator complex subunit 3